ncbi:MAG: amidohydrolase family protein [Ignavibacteriales bacterium]|nr:MAG: amidohydrolase family protein [Ignavibacteriales bacterium]
MNEKKIIIPSRIVSADKNNTVYRNHILEISGDKISGIKEFNADEIKNFGGEVYDAQNLTLCPGFIQTHIHLCQTLFRGLADDLQLLDWLQYKIFPFENAHDKNSLRTSVRIGLNELLKGGTTTILDMGTLRNQEIIFEELIQSGIRAAAGKCMIDRNDIFPQFSSSTEAELNDSYDLAKTFHNCEEGRIRYGFAPRFVLSCTEHLLKETAYMLQDFPGSIYHTHSSENKNEIAEVHKRYNKENIELFESLGVLSDCAVLAHCIHVSDNEIELLRNHNVKVSHCPSSNLKLASGIANIPRYLKEGISVSLGADGAPCNNSLNIFKEMMLASLIQKPFFDATVMNAKTIFRMATIEGAKALNIENETGSIEVGKKADLILLNINDSMHSLGSDDENIYSSIVYSGSSQDVNDVMVNGRWLVKNKSSLIFDDNELYANGSEELANLLKRV